ncbi:MAG: hypothetical protein ACYC7D_12450 [Nitrososphaerales archaeon]
MSILSELPKRFEDEIPVAKFPLAFFMGCGVFCLFPIWILVSARALAAF